MERELAQPKADGSLGGFYRPDAETLSALTRGTSKLRKYKELGADRPHERGNMAEALAEAAEVETKRRTKAGMKFRRKKVAKLRSKKKSVKKTTSVKRTAAPTSKKKVPMKADGKDKSSGKLVPLKVICSEMDLDPKATRVKLRRMIANGDLTFHDHSARWEFTQAQRKQIEAALSDE